MLPSSLQKANAESFAPVLVLLCVGTVFIYLLPVQNKTEELTSSFSEQ